MSLERFPSAQSAIEAERAKDIEARHERARAARAMNGGHTPYSPSDSGPEAQAWRAAHQPLPAISATATPPPATADQSTQPSYLQAWRAQFTSKPAVTHPGIDRFAENHQGAAAHGYGVTVDHTPLTASADPAHAGKDDEPVPFYYGKPITGADARLASGNELAALDPAGAHSLSGAKGFVPGRALMTPYGLIQAGGTGAKTYIGDETGNRTAQFTPQPAPAPTPNIAHNDLRGIAPPTIATAPQVDALSSGTNPATPFATPQISPMPAPMPTVQINPSTQPAPIAPQPTVQINPTAQPPRAAKPAPRPGSDLDWNLEGFKSFGNWLTGNSIHDRLHGRKDKLVSAY